MPSYYVTKCVADRQFALELVDEFHPQPNELITVTAIVLSDDGTEVPKGTAVYWRSRLKEGNLRLYAVRDDGHPDIKSESIDVITTTTNEYGRAPVFLASDVMKVYTVFASTTPWPKTEEGTAGPDLEGEGGQQWVAFATFNNNGYLLPPAISPLEDGNIEVEEMDGTVAKPPPQIGWMTAGNVNSQFSKDGMHEPPDFAPYIVWVSSGPDDPGQIVAPNIQPWVGGPINRKFPLSGLSQTNNSIAFMFYGSGVGYYSDVVPFGLDGIPLARPDDLGYTGDASLSPVRWKNTLQGDPYVQDIPGTLSTDQISGDGNLWLVVPSPTDKDGNPAYNKGDIITITWYLNGWDSASEQPTVMRTWITSETHYGREFVDNYAQDGKSYLPFWMGLTDLLGFGAHPVTGGAGYFWITYTYNGEPSLMPGYSPIRVNYSRKFTATG